MAHALRSLVCCIGFGLASASELVDRTETSLTFDGIGGLSGGGATSRLLPDYAEPQRTQILDYLFKPNFGASLQILKVEIGGDSQSTDGTEASHMHDSETVDLNTGYEWWLMKEAKARNPDIKLYGLAWAFPGWVGNHSGSPFDFPDLTARYLVEWVSGAKKQYDLDIDYLGIWNERSSDSVFVQTLRKALNAAGITGTKIVVKDGGNDICNDLAKDKAYRDAVDIVGLHYPSDFKDYSVCQSLGKPIWSSEESSSYDDMNGAACWGRIINSHWVINQMTSSIMWNLVGAYYHGTNWYASSMLTSVEPWSGHYEVNPVIWATAHVTQFTQIGWKYLANGNGSGELPKGGYYVTWVDPDSDAFTMNVVKISADHAACTRPKLPSFDTESETVTFQLAASMTAPAELQVWLSNFETFDGSEPSLMEHSTVAVESGAITLNVKVGDMYTITTLTDKGHKGDFGKIPDSSPSFPLPYSDDFKSTEESQDAKWLADQIGAFEVHVSDDGARSLKQMVPELPIGWSDQGSNGPMSLIGMREWQDIKIAVDFKLPTAKLAAHSCSADAFPHDLTNKRCKGLSELEGASPAACREACCAQSTCSVWQWDESKSSCWGGYVKDGGVSCQASTGFQSEGRTMSYGRAADAACVAARVDQMWRNGVVVCIDAEGQWNLTNSGPPLQDERAGGRAPPANIASGKATPPGVGSWHSLELHVESSSASAVLDGKALFNVVEVRDMDTGFGAIGSNGWFPIEYRNLAIIETPTGWEPAAGCEKASAGAVLTATPCARNGLVSEDQSWNLLPSFQLQHATSALCASASEQGPVVLAACNSATTPEQIFTNDYTRIRNKETSLTVSSVNKPLVGGKDGSVSVGSGGDWNTWSYFPNTRQLRNQYTTHTNLGYPMCLSTCSPSVMTV